MKEPTKTKCLNGELQQGDLVISIPEGDYDCLIGEVLEINLLGTPEHDAETENETDDVHVDFTVESYSKRREKEIEDMFSGLFRERKEFNDCPIGDAIMSPDSLIRITGIERDVLDTLLDSEENAAAFCRSIQKAPSLHDQLFDRLNDNLSDYHKHLSGFGQQEIIDMAGRISVMSDAHFYLTEAHDFENSELEYLLQFQNPLEVVADAWQKRVEDISDMSFVLDEVFEEQDALRNYPLVDSGDMNERSFQDGALEMKHKLMPVDSPRETGTERPSVLAQLRDAAEESKSRTASEPEKPRPEKGSR